MGKERKTCNICERCKIAPRLLRRTKRKSHTHVGANLSIYLNFLKLFVRQTDRQTDRQTKYCGTTAICAASRGKNSLKFNYPKTFKIIPLAD